jgi:hypothetical protein
MYELTRNRYRPDYIAGVVTIAPQFPCAWPNASLSSADVDLQYFAAADVDPQQHFPATSTLRVALARPAPRLEVHVPVRAQSVAAVRVTGLPDGATFNYTFKPGFGQTVLVVTAASVAGGAELSAATVTVSVAGDLPYRASIAATGLPSPPPPGLPTPHSPPRSRRAQCVL